MREEDRIEEAPVSCDDTLADAHRYVEGELDALRSSRLERHLGSCGPCRRHVAGLEEEKLWITENAVASPTLSARFVDEVMDRVRRERRHDRFHAGLRAATSFGAAFLGTAAAVVLALDLAGAFRSGLDAERERIGATAAERNGDRDGIPASGIPASGISGSGNRAPGSALLVGAPVRADCSLDGEDSFDWEDRVDPVFPSTAIVCPPCAFGPSGGSDADGHEVAFAGTPASRGVRADVPSRSNAGRAGSTPTVSLRHAFQVASWIGRGPRDASAARGAGPAADPCTPDPNADGRTDVSDVAYALGVLNADELPESLAATEAGDAVLCEEDSCSEV